MQCRVRLKLSWMFRRKSAEKWHKWFFNTLIFFLIFNLRLAKSRLCSNNTVNFSGRLPDNQNQTRIASKSCLIQSVNNWATLPHSKSPRKQPKCSTIWPPSQRGLACWDGLAWFVLQQFIN